MGTRLGRGRLVTRLVIQTMDTPKFDKAPSSDQDDEIAPKKELSCNQTAQNVVLHELASYDGSGEQTSRRDVPVQDSKVLVDSHPHVFLGQGTKGSADQELLSQEHYTDAYSENCERVQTIEEKNQELKENFHDLQLREKEVKDEEIEKCVKRCESSLDLQVREPQLDETSLKLEKVEHAFPEQQRKDRHLAREQELQEEEPVLNVREQKLQVKEREVNVREQKLQVKEQELNVREQKLQVKDRELRAKSLELQNERDQQVEKFALRQKEQRVLEIRLQNVTKDAERLENENKKLKSDVTLLGSEVAFLLRTRGELFCASSDSGRLTFLKETVYSNHEF